MTPDQFRECATLASRAPSPHNIQPALWRRNGEKIELWEDTRRWLPVGDPYGKDNELSLGMAMEAMSIALSAHGLALDGIEWRTAPYETHLSERRIRATADLVPCPSADPLHVWQAKRHSYRGKFRTATKAEKDALATLIPRHSFVAVIAPERHAFFGQRHDGCSRALLADPSFNAELYRWLRFDDAQIQAQADGLDFRCLELSRPEAMAAKWLMKPSVVKWLHRAGLSGLLVGESAKTQSATQLLVFHVPDGVRNVDAGRAWYRFWLELTAGGFCGVPMSSLADEVSMHPLLREAAGISGRNRIIGVMRVGPVPGAAIPVSRRRPAEFTDVSDIQ